MQGRLENEIKLHQSTEAILKELPPFVNEWYLNMRASKKTASSCLDYVRKIRKFLTYINDKPLTMNANEITLQTCESYMIACQTKVGDDGMEVFTSDSYQQGIWNSINSLLKFLCKRNYITHNFMEDVECPKNRDINRINEERILLTQKDFNKIFKAVQTGSDFMGGIFNNRDALIILLFMTTGIRESALASINIEDINLADKTLSVIDKGNKTHIYVLNEQVISYYQGWLEDRDSLVNPGSGTALFVNRYGKRIAAQGIADIVKKYCEDAIGKKLSPHKLRSGFCSILYDKTKDIEFVRRVVGHSNIQTTQRYIKTDGKEKEMAVQIMDKILN